MLPLAGGAPHCFPFPRPPHYDLPLLHHPHPVKALHWLSPGLSGETIAAPYICSILKFVCPAMKSILSVCSTKHLRKPLKGVLHFYPPLGNQTVILTLLILTVTCVCSHLSKTSSHQKTRPFDVPTFFCLSPFVQGSRPCLAVGLGNDFNFVYHHILRHSAPVVEIGDMSVPLPSSGFLISYTILI